eukprot:1517811-Prymnesium_polylepis.1
MAALPAAEALVLVAVSEMLRSRRTTQRAGPMAQSASRPDHVGAISTRKARATSVSWGSCTTRWVAQSTVPR